MRSGERTASDHLSSPCESGPARLYAADARAARTKLQPHLRSASLPAALSASSSRSPSTAPACSPVAPTSVPPTFAPSPSSSPPPPLRGPVAVANRLHASSSRSTLTSPHPFLPLRLRLPARPAAAHLRPISLFREYAEPGTPVARPPLSLIDAAGGGGRAAVRGERTVDERRCRCRMPRRPESAAAAAVRVVAPVGGLSPARARRVGSGERGP